VQEVQRVDSLLTVVRTSLTDLGKAVRGLALMSADLDAVGKALFDGKVPAMWLKKSFPSLKVHLRHLTSRSALDHGHCLLPLLQHIHLLEHIHLLAPTA